MNLEERLIFRSNLIINERIMLTNEYFHALITINYIKCQGCHFGMYSLNEFPF